VKARKLAYLDALGIEAFEPKLGARAARAAGAAPLLEPAARALAGASAAGSLDSLDWAELRARVAACTACELHRTRTQTVFGVGNVKADWLVIGEAPGADEDRQGEPFVGRAGQLLNSMLRAIGLAREQVYIANILKCRPPGNRDPKPQEADCCTPFLQRQIALIRPKVILVVGRIAAQNLLATQVPLARLRGQVHRYGPLATPLVVTYHPAYLLRSPGEKRKAWVDLRFARAVLEGGAA
jgi:DNA polymerase